MSGNRNVIVREKFTLKQLITEADFQTEEISLFDCSDDELNVFFKDKAYAHKCDLMAETYLFVATQAYKERLPLDPLCMISFCNDNIKLTKEDLKGPFKTFAKYLKRGVRWPKRNYKSFPAVKITRLGVQKELQDKGVGTEVLNLTKELFTTENRTGCRFLTVDAYDRSRGFYEKNDFLYLQPPEDEEQQDQRYMFYDLHKFDPTV